MDLLSMNKEAMVALVNETSSLVGDMASLRDGLPIVHPVPLDEINLNDDASTKFEFDPEIEIRYLTNELRCKQDRRGRTKNQSLFQSRLRT